MLVHELSFIGCFFLVCTLFKNMHGVSNKILNEVYSDLSQSLQKLGQRVN